MDNTPENKGGRPPITIDEKVLERLAKHLVPKKTIAHILGISVDTLDRRFADKIAEWQADTDSKTATVFLDEALVKREPWALKLLVQNRLDYADKKVVENTGTQKVVLEKSELAERIEQVKNK